MNTRDGMAEIYAELYFDFIRKIVKSGKKCDSNFSDSMEIQFFRFMLFPFLGINKFAYFFFLHLRTDLRRTFHV